MSKVISTERGKGEQLFQVIYEKAMNVEPRLLTERELLKTNELR